MSNADSNQIAGYGDLSLHWILVLLDLIRRRYSFMSERLILWLTCMYYNSVGGTYARNNAVGISQLESRWKPNELSKVYVSYIPVSISNALAAGIWCWGKFLGANLSIRSQEERHLMLFQFHVKTTTNLPNPLTCALTLWLSAYLYQTLRKKQFFAEAGEFLGSPGIVIVIVIEGLDLGQKTLN